ncbi:hypothetical protein [Moraxella lacunata]
MRFTPHLLPISPQCRTNFSVVGESFMIVAFLTFLDILEVFIISVNTEI